MSAYCTTADVAQASAKFNALTSEETTRATSAIAQASAQVETLMGTFFNKRHLQVVTQTVHNRQRKLFLPAPCISIDASGVTENGTILVQGTDFYLYQPADGLGNPKGCGWMEKVQPPSSGFIDVNYATFWTNNQLAVSVSGQFGYATIPDEIVKLTAWMAGRLLGWIVFTFTESDGASKSSMNLKFPDWALGIIRSRSVSTYDEQFYQITVLT